MWRMDLVFIQSSFQGLILLFMSKKPNLIHTKQYTYTKPKILLSKLYCLNAARYLLHKQEKHTDEVQLSGIKELTQLT